MLDILLLRTPLGKVNLNDVDYTSGHKLLPINISEPLGFLFFFFFTTVCRQMALIVREASGLNLQTTLIMPSWLLGM